MQKITFTNVHYVLEFIFVKSLSGNDLFESGSLDVSGFKKEQFNVKCHIRRQIFHAHFLKNSKDFHRNTKYRFFLKFCCKRYTGSRSVFRLSLFLIYRHIDFSQTWTSDDDKYRKKAFVKGQRLLSYDWALPSPVLQLAYKFPFQWWSRVLNSPLKSNLHNKILNLH